MPVHSSYGEEEIIRQKALLRMRKDNEESMIE